jgi:hypothetical protein
MDPTINSNLLAGWGLMTQDGVADHRLETSNYRAFWQKALVAASDPGTYADQRSAAMTPPFQPISNTGLPSSGSAKTS